MYILLAFLSCIFASLTTIFAKIGIEGINSHLATFIRTFVALFMALMMVFVTNAYNQSTKITKINCLFLILSGISTGISWLLYYRALQIGKVSKVVVIDKMSVVFTLLFAFIFLNEKITLKSLLGTLLISLGTFVMVI